MWSSSELTLADPECHCVDFDALPVKGSGVPLTLNPKVRTTSETFLVFLEQASIACHGP